MDFRSLPFLARSVGAGPGGPALLGIEVLPLTTAATPGAQSVTVPVGTQGVVFMARALGVGLTLSSNFAGTWTDVPPTSGSVFLRHAPVTSNGSRTITPEWTDVVGEGPIAVLFYVGGVDASAPANWVRDADCGETTSKTVDTQAGDILFVLETAYAPGGEFPALPSGYTSLGTVAYNNDTARARQRDTVTGSTTTVNEAPVTGTNYHGLCVISIF